MKIAIVQDDLMRRGGAEQVALCIHEAFPDAPIFTLAYSPGNTYPEFKTCKIITSWFQPLAWNETVMKVGFFPLGMWAMQHLDVRGFDVIILSSTYCAKYVKVDPDALVINYCHSPFRLAWQPESYGQYIRAKGAKRKIFDWVIGRLRKTDLKYAKRTDYFISNANEMADRIKRVYNPRNEVVVINPPVACVNFHVSPAQDDYYLVVCRLEHYKKVDIVIEVFNEMKKRLIVVGRGSQERKLKSMAGSTIEFRSGISKEELAQLYSKCKALIFPQHEDYGITPLEANASGRPVIAYGKGGVLETMVPLREDAAMATAVFFSEQTPQSLTAAIERFEDVNFDPGFIRSHAQKFDKPIFVDAIREFVLSRNPVRP